MSGNRNSTYCMNTAYCDGCDRTGGNYQRCSQYAEKEDDGGGPLVQEPLKSSSVSAEEGKEGREDGNGNKVESVLGAASAQAPTTHNKPFSKPQLYRL